MDIESELWLLWKWGNKHQHYTDNNQHDDAEDMRDWRDELILGVINYVD